MLTDSASVKNLLAQDGLLLADAPSKLMNHPLCIKVGQITKELRGSSAIFITYCQNALLSVRCEIRHLRFSYLKFAVTKMFANAWKIKTTRVARSSKSQSKKYSFLHLRYSDRMFVSDSSNCGKLIRNAISY